MEFKKGDRIKHPKIDDWGLGEILENSNGDTVRVFFVGAGEKTLSLKYVQPVKVEDSEASSPVLDNLKLNNHPLKRVGSNNGLKVRIRVD